MIMFINTISHQQSFVWSQSVREQGLLLAQHILFNLILRSIVVFWTHVGPDKTLVLCNNLARLGIQLEGVFFAECVACVQVWRAASWNFDQRNARAMTTVFVVWSWLWWSSWPLIEYLLESCQQCWQRYHWSNGPVCFAQLTAVCVPLRCAPFTRTMCTCITRSTQCA